MAVKGNGPTRLLVVFPGQGSQQVGMGQQIAARYPAAAALYAEAGALLGYDLASLCFNGPEEKLRETSITQPALLATCLAFLAPLREAGVEPDLYAGHSLGEYTALVAAGALSFTEGLPLVAQRGEWMAAAAQETDGGMAAVLGLQAEQVASICEESGATMANDNAPGQLVISGPTPALERAVALARERGARRVVPLNVAGAFHSSCMAPAARKLREQIERTPFQRARVPVIANLSAGPVREPEEIRAALTGQLTGSVRWQESIRQAVALGVDTLVEVGPGGVLAGLARRIDESLRVLSVSDPASVETTTQELCKR